MLSRLLYHGQTGHMQLIWPFLNELRKGVWPFSVCVHSLDRSGFWVSNVELTSPERIVLTTYISAVISYSFVMTNQLLCLLGWLGMWFVVNTEGKQG